MSPHEPWLMKRPDDGRCADIARVLHQTSGAERQPAAG